MDDLDMPRDMPDLAHAPNTHRILRALWRRYWNLSAQVDRLSSREHHLEDTMAETQTDLDTLAQNLEDSKTRIQGEITALQQANPELDFSSLNAAVADIANVVPAPVDPAPADDAA